MFDWASGERLGAQRATCERSLSSRYVRIGACFSGLDAAARGGPPLAEGGESRARGRDRLLTASIPRFHADGAEGYRDNGLPATRVNGRAATTRCSRAADVIDGGARQLVR